MVPRREKSSCPYIFVLPPLPIAIGRLRQANNASLNSPLLHCHPALEGKRRIVSAPAGSSGCHCSLSQRSQGVLRSGGSLWTRFNVASGSTLACLPWALDAKTRAGFTCNFSVIPNAFFKHACSINRAEKSKSVLQTSEGWYCKAALLSDVSQLHSSADSHRSPGSNGSQAPAPAVLIGGI